MSRLTKNYVYNLMYQLFILFVPLITAPYLARILGPTNNGTFSYIQSTATLVSTVALLGIYAYGNRQIAYVRDSTSKLTEVYNEIMSARLILSAVCTVLYFGFVVLVGKYIALFTIYYTYVVAYCIDCTWLFIGVEDMKWAVIKNSITKILSVSGIFLLIHSSADLPLYVGLQGLSFLVSNLLAFTQVHAYVGKFRFDFSNLRKDIIGSALLFLPSVAATIYLQSDKVLIELMTGATSQVSFYDYSEKIITIPLTLITVLSTVMMPRIANEFMRNNTRAIQRLIRKAASFAFFAAFPLTFGIILISDKFVPWYLGAKFLPTALAIKLIAPIIIANTITNLSGNQYFTATNQISILMKAQVTAAVGNIILNLCLIPLMGFYGSAIATLITSFLCAYIQTKYLLKQIPIPGIFSQAAKSLISSVIMFVVAFLFTAKLQATPLTTLIQVLVGGVVYLICCLINHDENLKLVLQQVRNLISRG